MSPDELLDETLAKARKVRVGGALDPAEAAQRAIESARLEARVRRARRGRFVMGAAAAAVVLTLAWGAWGTTRGSGPAGVGRLATKAVTGSASVERTRPIAEPIATPVERGSEVEARVRLASGDLLVGAPGVAFDVLSEARDRVVRLDGGEMFFDIAHRPGGSFVVEATDVSVTVLGTVFSIRRERDAIGVRVFEGSVLVRGADGVAIRRLGAGEVWVSGALAERDEWRARSEREWRSIARSGRPDGRAAPAASVRRELGAASEATDGTAEPEAAGTLGHARGRLAEGDFEGVLRLSEAHLDEGGWVLLRADALRGLGRAEDAAGAYESAARLLGDGRRIQAAFAAAQLRAESAPEAALGLLDRFGVTAPRSPLEERGRALRIQLLRRVGRNHEADEDAQAHGARFGSGP